MLSNLFTNQITLFCITPATNGNAKEYNHKFILDSAYIQKQRGTNVANGTTVQQSSGDRVIIKDLTHYKPSNFADNGFYLSDNKQYYFTVNSGDLIVFQAVSDKAPSNRQEFTQLQQKYKDISITVQSVAVNIYGTALDNIVVS